jgi:hygromycin-B 7''-O-kinase
MIIMSAQVPELSSLGQYRERFMSTRYWAPYVEAVCERHHLAPHDAIRCHNPGTYPTYIVNNRWVIKFFGELFNGAHSFAAELDANHMIASDDAIPAPALLAQDYLHGPDTHWRWPYLIFEYMDGESFGEAYECISLHDRLAIAHRLGELVCRLHQLPLTNTSLLLPTWDAFTNTLEAQRVTCAQRQLAWHTLPTHLINQIEGYLPPLAELIDRTQPPTFMHGDITGDHVFCRIMEGHWEIKGLIDYGDALVGDPAFELIALHLDAFRCDKRLLAAYLNSYGVSHSEWHGMVKHIMSLTLLHQFDVLSIVRKHHPQITQFNTVEDLAECLWDPNAPGIDQGQ